MYEETQRRLQEQTELFQKTLNKQACECDDLKNELKKHSAEKDVTDGDVDYKLLYKECKETLETQKHFHTREMINIKSKYDTDWQEFQILREEHEQLKDEHEKDFTDMKLNYESAIEEKDKYNGSLRKKIEEYDAKLCTQTLNDVCGAVPCGVLTKRDNIKDMFRLKPTRKTKNSATDLHVNTCEQPSCDSINVDMVKCNVCLKFSCENCNKVPVAKLKTVMDKSLSVYFVCDVCKDKCSNGSIPATTDHEQTRDERNEQVPVNIGQMMKQIQQTIEKQMTDMESKIEMIVKKKIDEKMPTTMATGEASNSLGSTENNSHAVTNHAASQPNDFRVILQEAENDRLVEESEKEKRAKNFIVHGLQETGDDDEQIKTNDTQIVKKFLEVIGVEEEPKSFSRIGKKDAKNKRTLKVIMKSNQGKINVLQNLRKLKGREEIFGKISVTDDHTVNEREQIKRYVEDAKAKSSNDAENVWRVRGDPKNGLKLVSFPRVKDIISA